MKKFIIMLISALVVLSVGIHSSSVQATELIGSGSALKPVMVLITEDDCKNCLNQEENWDSFVKRNKMGDLVTFVKMDANNPKYKDFVQLYSIEQKPTIMSFSKKSDIVYINNGLHLESELEKIMNGVLNLMEEN